MGLFGKKKAGAAGATEVTATPRSQATVEEVVEEAIQYRVPAGGRSSYAPEYHHPFAPGPSAPPTPRGGFSRMSEQDHYDRDGPDYKSDSEYQRWESASRKRSMYSDHPCCLHQKGHEHSSEVYHTTYTCYDPNCREASTRLARSNSAHSAAHRPCGTCCHQQTPCSMQTCTQACCCHDAHHTSQLAPPAPALPPPIVTTTTYQTTTYPSPVYGRVQLNGPNAGQIFYMGQGEGMQGNVASLQGNLAGLQGNMTGLRGLPMGQPMLRQQPLMAGGVPVVIPITRSGAQVTSYPRLQ